MRGQRGVICRYYDVTELCDAERFEAGMAALPWESRRRKVMRYRFGKDRRLCLGAGLLCARMLRDAGADDLTMELGPNDKPRLRNCPAIHFNISHSGSLVACAVSDAPVGVDVEQRQPYDEGVARLCFTDAEVAWVIAQEDAGQAFTRLWTRKESYLKLLGTGLSRPANSFEALPGAVPEDGVRFVEREVDGYAICVCTRTTGGQFVVESGCGGPHDDEVTIQEVGVTLL